MYDQLLANLAILVLSGFVGFSVISKVPNTLHTPLMSGTNAIHGIVLVGALVVLGRVEHPSLAEQIILFVAVVFGTLNVVGGFVVTDRMLGMFKGKKPAAVKASGRICGSRRGNERASTMNYLVTVLYIIAFAMFIYGLMGLTGPKTAVRGNWIAAAGMAVAVIATLISIRHTENWPLIIAGLLVGVALGVPPARLTKMTAMPQLVALFNGVGGGTVALIALSEFIDTHGFSAFQHGESPTVHIVVASLFAAIIGSISFWGSIIAFGKLQEILPGRPIGIGKVQQPLNILLLIAAIAAAVVIGVNAHPGTGGASLWWMIGLLAAAGVLGLMVVLPIGGADMPVVISLLNAMTGLSAAAAGLALNNTAMIVAGMIVGASGSILTNLMAKAMNRSIPAIVAGGFGGGGTAASSDDGGDKVVKATSAADAAIQMAYANQVIVVPGYGLAVAQAQHAVKDLANLLETGAFRSSTRSTRWQGGCPGT